MLTTTLAFSWQARWTRLMWPAWRAPIVGTRPIECPSCRQPREVASIAAGVSMTAGGLPGAVLDLFFHFLGCWGCPVGRVSVLRSREFATSDLTGELPRGPVDLFGKVCVALDKLGRLAGGQAKHVVEDEHLAVGPTPRPDPDRRNAKGLRDPGSEGVGHALRSEEHTSELQSPCNL